MTKDSDRLLAPYMADGFTSYSLNFEDVMLHRLFAGRDPGFYIDVGAGHPLRENDTRALYEAGWHGINVEPNEGFFHALQLERPRDRNLCLALSDETDEGIIYHEISDTGLSTCDAALARLHESRGHKVRLRRVPVSTLAHILSEAGVPALDLLKVDVEGMEERVLAGNDWERFRPKVVLVEATFPERPERRPTNVRTFLEARSYRHAYFDGLNDFYLERGFDARNAFALPPNVFDGFTSGQIVHLRAAVDALEVKIAGLTAENRYLKHDVDDFRGENSQLKAAVEGAHNEILALSRTIDSIDSIRRQSAAEADSHQRTLKTSCDSLSAQNRLLSQKVADVQTKLQAFTTNTVWRPTSPIRRVLTVMPAPIRRFGRRALTFGWASVLQLPNKLAERRERMLATTDAPPEPLVADERALSPTEAPTNLDVVPPDLVNLISPCFDAVWYDSTYALETRSVRGLDHYFRIGMKAGYSPNAVFDEESYLRVNPDVAEAVQAGTFVCGFDHYIRCGRLEKRSGHQRRPRDYSHLRPMFDEDWYDRTYELKDEQLHGFDHYLAKGARSGYSPYADFDEKFYSAFYRDVGMTISSRGYLCGFEHYVLVGRTENRLTKPIFKEMLDLRYPGLTDPVGIAQARAIERRLAPIAACSGAGEQSYWILVPTLDPNIFFGGYKALIEFVVGLGLLKRPITVVICDYDDDGTYFKYWITQQIRIAEAFSTVRIVNGRRLTAPLRLSPTDKIFAYSAWEAHLAHHMAAHVESGLFAWLVQEYEPIFHDYSAEHAVVARAYHLPHYPIFNSTELKNYFQHHKLGIFSADRLPSPRRDFAIFEHVLTKLPAPTLDDLKGRPSRTLMFYARPEVHGKRNLFPLALIALEEMAQQGSFVGPWEFHGLGALSEMTIPLGRGHKLNLHAKMTEADYAAFMHKVDVGLSLMYAPHPGLIAFEMASVGARVVTNTFDNRSETYLRGLSENLIPCEPTISGIKQALTKAIESLRDFSGRIRGMRINCSQSVNSWSAVFNDDFFRCEMGSFLGTDQQIVSKKTSLDSISASATGTGSGRAG